MFLVKKWFNLLCFEKSVSFITHTYTIACDLYLMGWVLRCSGAQVLRCSGLLAFVAIAGIIRIRQICNPAPTSTCLLCLRIDPVPFLVVALHGFA
jgi:hypothetical protein